MALSKPREEDLSFVTCRAGCRCSLARIHRTSPHFGNRRLQLCSLHHHHACERTFINSRVSCKRGKKSIPFLYIETFRVCGREAPISQTLLRSLSYWPRSSAADLQPRPKPMEHPVQSTTSAEPRSKLSRHPGSRLSRSAPDSP